MRVRPADTATYAPGEDAATIEHRAFIKAAWRLVPLTPRRTTESEYGDDPTHISTADA
jgi:hypothetical protein